MMEQPSRDMVARKTLMRASRAYSFGSLPHGCLLLLQIPNAERQPGEWPGRREREESFQALSTSSKVPFLRKQFLESAMSVGRATLLHGSRKLSRGRVVMVFKFFKISVNILSIHRAGSLRAR